MWCKRQTAVLIDWMFRGGATGLCSAVGGREILGSAKDKREQVRFNFLPLDWEKSITQSTAVVSRCFSLSHTMLQQPSLHHAETQLA